MKKAFSLTHIEYNEEDGIIGWVMALFSLAPVFFIVIICSSVLVHRDMHSLFLLLYMIGCTLFNQFLKHIIRQPRPACLGGVQQSYGMPSDHSQFMSCLAVYLTLWLYRNVQLKSSIQNWFAITALWITWLIVVYSRVYLEEHSFSQVIVGIVVGIVYGFICYILNEKIFRSYYYSISKLGIFQWLQFKDYSYIKNALEEESRLVDNYYASCHKVN